MEERVVLVDEDDREVGTEEKLRAHQGGGRLHRAVSVFVLNARGEVLLQRRAAGKYHSGGQWTNTCCSHPRPGEPVAEAARRRLREEMGLECDLAPAFTFTYRADVGGGLVEHEFDHVFLGRCDGEPRPDPAEADDWRWATLDDVARDAAAHPDRYTPWFRVLLADPVFLDRLRQAIRGATSP
ncbi:MAG TPA: isopentenyl-diphosphate Delta-isomerase [Longimicrobiaceae bacterium]|nr:isopentenyl-diphosphate Delta-isomerase [Longimicrobiaceae bacterium]